MKGNDFGAFLGALNQAKGEPVVSAPVSNDVIAFLLERDNPTPVVDLLARTHTSVGSLAKTLDTLANANLVQVTQTGNEETVCLTEAGRQVANMGLIGGAVTRGVNFGTTSSAVTSGFNVGLMGSGVKP